MIYKYLGYIAMLTTPLAASIFFGWSVYEATVTMTGNVSVSIVAGIATAIALESVGLLSGHVASDFHKRNDPRWRVAAVIMVGYVVAGLYELWGTAGAVVFAISPAVYVLVALQHVAAQEQHKEQEHGTHADKERINDKEYARRQKEIDKQRQHELRLEQMRIDAAKRANQPAKRASEFAYICSCSREFGSQNALNAHKRTCKVSANGQRTVSEMSANGTSK
jgi:hypothetical protein